MSVRPPSNPLRHARVPLHTMRQTQTANPMTKRGSITLDQSMPHPPLVKQEVGVMQGFRFVDERPTRRKRKQRPEDALQIAAVDFLHKALPKECVFFHIPNGGARTRTEAGIFKAMGVVAGILDICIMTRNHVIWFEFKAAGTKHRQSALSDAQRAMISRLGRLGHWVFVVDSLDEVENSLRSVGLQLRATLFTKGVLHG